MSSQPQIISPGMEEIDVREVPMTSDALAVLNRSEIEQQVEISRKYPRSLQAFRTKLEQYSNINESVALSMFYSLERRKADGTKSAIVGPSVRFAETLLPCWGNSRAGIRILGDQGTVAAAQGIFFDCESNTGINVEAQRSIVGSKGNRFSNDMIVTTGNAAGSVAYRNAITRGVPRALWLDIYEKCKLTAVGKAESFGSQVAKAVEEFSKQGVTQVALLNMLGAASVRDITADHILTMRTMFREIRDGEKTIEDVFGSPEDAEIDSIMQQLGWNTTKQRMSVESFKGKRSDHLQYLRGEIAKIGGTPHIVKPAHAEETKATVTTEGDTATQSADAKPSEPTTASEQTQQQTESANWHANTTSTTTAVASTSQASKPAARRPAPF